jgi:hypothetical protein
MKIREKIRNCKKKFFNFFFLFTFPCTGRISWLRLLLSAKIYRLILGRKFKNMKSDGFSAAEYVITRSQHFIILFLFCGHMYKLFFIIGFLGKSKVKPGSNTPLSCKLIKYNSIHWRHQIFRQNIIERWH